MLWFQSFQCTNEECKHVFDNYVEKQGGKITIYPSCPLCQSATKNALGNPKHHKHVSHSEWRRGHGS